MTSCFGSAVRSACLMRNLQRQKAIWAVILMRNVCAWP